MVKPTVSTRPPKPAALLPSILLSQHTQKLLADIFRAPNLFDGVPRIRQRIVAWGSRQPFALPHDANVISEDALLQTLNSRLPVPPTNTNPHLDWTILTARQPPPSLPPPTATSAPDPHKLTAWT